MNLMARCSTEFQELVIVAFEIMNNHIHIVLAGEEEKIKEFSWLSGDDLYAISVKITI